MADDARSNDSAYAPGMGQAVHESGLVRRRMAKTALGIPAFSPPCSVEVDVLDLDAATDEVIRFLEAGRLAPVVPPERCARDTLETPAVSMVMPLARRPTLYGVGPDFIPLIDAASAEEYGD